MYIILSKDQHGWVPILVDVFRHFFSLRIQEDVIARKPSQDASNHRPGVVHRDNVAHSLKLWRGKVKEGKSVRL